MKIPEWFSQYKSEILQNIHDVSIIEEYNITNPILIAEKAKEIFDTDVSIHYISDYLTINHEDLEKSNRQQYYQLNYLVIY